MIPKHALLSKACFLLQLFAGDLQGAEHQVFPLLRFAVGVVPGQNAYMKFLSGRNKDRLVQFHDQFFVFW